MGVFVLQMPVGPDQPLRGEHHLVLGLLELPEELFGPRSENRVITVSGGMKREIYCSVEPENPNEGVVAVKIPSSTQLGC